MVKKALPNFYSKRRSDGLNDIRAKLQADPVVLQRYLRGKNARRKGRKPFLIRGHDGQR